MPELTVPRPVLRNFRALAFSGQNKRAATGVAMQLTVRQEINLGLAVPTVSGEPLMVGVMIKLNASATNEQDANDVVTFAGEYEARFYYASGVTEESVALLLDDDNYRRLLVAQAFPLALAHLRGELQAMGLDARELPFGLDLAFQTNGAATPSATGILQSASSAA